MNSQKARFVDLLEDLFQLNQPELDFGLYRIVHARSKEIRAFMQNELATEIDAAFAGQANQSASQTLQTARQKVLDNLADDAFDAAGELKPQHHATKLGKEFLLAQQQARDGAGPLANDAQIYDHLYRFFSRYYDKGDFMSKRYFVAENDQRALPYAVPYDGREVLLHWANKDQYYIKSSEAFSNYSFDLTEALRKETERQKVTPGFDFGPETGAAPLKVHLRLAAAAEGEHNNVKDSQERFYLIHPPAPVLLETARNGAQELVIQFEYRPDPDKTGQAGTWQQRRLAEAEAAVLQALAALPQAQTFKRGLEVLAATDKRPDRTLLAKYLGQFADRNTMDYFIHKNLGGFLRRELDFYIKNEIMRLDDIESSEAPRVEAYLSKLRVLRRIAKRIIDFLAQLEDFQKKLWLKKKFVVTTNYCFTLDRISEDLYSEIASNEAQRAEWIRLYSIDKIDGDLANQGYSTPLSVEFLVENKTLVVDTIHFTERFKNEVLSKQSNLDDSLNGLLLHSANPHALRLLGEKYKEKFDAVYIDPPYNTSENAFLYKNLYKHSSWATMIAEGIDLSTTVISGSGAILAAIDDTEYSNLKAVLENSYGSENYVGTLAIEVNPAGQNIRPNAPARSHDYCHIFAKNADDTFFNLRELTPDEVAEYDQTDKKGKYYWDNLRRRGGNSRPTDRPKQWFPLYIDYPNVRVPTMEWIEADKAYSVIDTIRASESEAWPIDPKGENRIWRTNPAGARKRIRDGDISVLTKAGRHEVSLKSRMPTGKKPKTLWRDSRHSATTYGSKLLIDILGSGNMFSYPKSLNLVSDCISAWLPSDGAVLDFFGGSGTTAHAAISLNREDDGSRFFTLIEMGGYFYNTTIPRVKKAIYSSSWKDGNPKDRDGISYAFKYLDLESFEDSLNNLILPNESILTQHAAPESAPLRRDYTLHYWLNFETANSPSLLNVREFADPTAYKLKIKQPGSDVQVEKAVDLVETFNWLIGLHVALLDKPRTYAIDLQREPDPDLPDDQHTRWQASSITEAEDGEFWFRQVDGHVLTVPGDEASHERVLVVWRKLTGDAGRDQAALEAWLVKAQINPRDTEYATIYINGSHALPSDGSSGARLRMTEETFAQRMWEDT